MNAQQCWHPLLVTAKDADVQLQHAILEHAGPQEHNNRILLGKFLETAVKIWYFIGVLARTAELRGLWRSATFLSFRA